MKLIIVLAILASSSIVKASDDADNGHSIIYQEEIDVRSNHMQK